MLFVVPDVLVFRLPVDPGEPPPVFPVCPKMGSAASDRRAITTKRKRMEVDIFSSQPVYACSWMPTGSSRETGKNVVSMRDFVMAVIIRPLHRRGCKYDVTDVF
jgi:hypothetical protein